MHSSQSTLDYRLSVLSQSRHLFEVTLSIPALDKPHLVLSLPAWIPGSYMIRDFARNIITLKASAADGQEVPVTKLDKQSWQIATQGQAVEICYQVYAFDLSVRSAFLNDEYGFCNGTSVFLGVDGYSQLPCRLSIDCPQNQPHWQIETTMPLDASGGSAWQYHCADYDELIDHPIFMGQCTTASFKVDEVEFVLLFSGSTPVDLQRICTDLAPVCQHHLDLFGKPAPVQRYVFMTLVADSGFGGLEHRSSTALMFPRFDLPLKGDPSQQTDGYVTFLSLCSHELFHTWHVKRIKPEVMVAPDLSAEVYTDQLWIYEGFTSFYDDVTLARSGVISAQKYLELLGQNLTRLKQNAGRHKQSAAASSFDAWTKFYKQDASAINNIVSYYNKGGIIALGLDLLLRQRSGNQIKLDNLMQQLWQDYGREMRGTPDSVVADVCLSQFDIDIRDYLNDVVYGTQDVPLQAWLQEIGVALHLRERQGKDDKGGTPAKAGTHRHQLGAAVKSADTGVTVLQVREGLAACQAGLQINDRIIALDDYQVNDSLLQRLLDASQQTHVELTVLRDGRLLRLTLPVLPSQQDVCYLTIEDAGLFDAWLGKA